MRMLILLGVVLGGAWAALPDRHDCVPAQSKPFSSFNPANAFGWTDEIRAKPHRVGQLRNQGPLPTGHFATGHIKSDQIWPMILTPYQTLLTSNGAVHDAYTMDRWTDPKRSDLMQQQSAWEKGKPWNKLDSMGTNMKQMTSGPDGSPFSFFTGKSGIQVTIDGNGDPQMREFGELYANFKYWGSNSGSMELPLVRGASLMTHIMKNANPIVKPFCLSSINGTNVKFACPEEPVGSDGGDGYVDGQCQGSQLTIYFHNSKPIDLKKVQYAASPSNNWNRHMHGCTSSTCKLQNGDRTVKITVPRAQGTMNYAINYIGHFVIPGNWHDQPKQTTCRSKRAIGDMTVSATCQSSRQITISLDLVGVAFPGISKFQYALEPASKWKSGFTPPMHTCTASVCKYENNKLVIRTRAPAYEYKLALNMIGARTFPAQQWLEKPYYGKCDGSTTTDGNRSGGSSTAGPSTSTSSRPTGTSSNRQSLSAGKKFVLELDEPGQSLNWKTRKFVLYFTETVVPKVDYNAQTITFEPSSGGRYNGLLQVGYVGSSNRGDNSQTSFLDSYSGFYSYKPKVSYCVSQSAGKGYLDFQWNPMNAYGNAAPWKNLLMIAMPHHDRLLTLPKKNTPFTFNGYEKNDWLMELPILHTSVDPDPQAVQKVKNNWSQRQDIINAINNDVPNQNLDAVCHSNSYGAGKGIGMVARLASLSRAFGTNHYIKLEESIKNCLEKWLRINDVLKDKKKFRYDTVWGGIYARGTDDPVVGWDTDFGFPFYNDHHFHLGYFIYAAAYYVKHHRSWGNDHQNRIYALARDVGNPSSQDEYFPVSRQKDIYTGFSWASGLVPGTRQEESASEGINCYHGLAALGEAFGDANMKQTGQILLSMEVLSTREYWQVRPDNKAHFPPVIQQNGVVGMVTEPDFYAYTLNWPCDPNIFPQRHGCLVGIQVIPITSVSKYWVDKEWASSISKNCEYAINPASNPLYYTAEMTSDLGKQLYPGWKAFCHAAMAPLDDAHAKAAADYVKQTKTYKLVPGTGIASTLLFIYGST